MSGEFTYEFEIRRLNGLLQSAMEDNQRLVAEIRSMRENFERTEQSRDFYRRIYEEVASKATRQTGEQALG